MATLNIVVAPIMGAGLVTALRDSQCNATVVVDECDAVAYLKGFESHQKVALVIGNDPRTDTPHYNEVGELYDIMFFTDSPENMYRLIRRTAERIAPCDLWVMDDLAHNKPQAAGENSINLDEDDQVTASDIFYYLRNGVGREFSVEALPNIMDMRVHGKGQDAGLLQQLAAATLQLEVASQNMAG
ncbi:MAG: hypothetical protein OSB62_01120 [Alphaproteobacteria bacterium]|nr:hypothetical protein [Alphaproteobacteria bacterium]